MQPQAVALQQQNLKKATELVLAYSAVSEYGVNEAWASPQGDNVPGVGATLRDGEIEGMIHMYCNGLSIVGLPNTVFLRSDGLTIPSVSAAALARGLNRLEQLLAIKQSADGLS